MFKEIIVFNLNIYKYELVMFLMNETITNFFFKFRLDSYAILGRSTWNPISHLLTHFMFFYIVFNYYNN